MPIRTLTILAAIFAASLFLLATAESANATTLMKFDARTQVERAAAVVVARPLRVETLPEKWAGGTEVFTYTTIRIERVLKGALSSGDTVVLKDFGGSHQASGITTFEDEIPLLRTDATYLLVLAADSRDPWGAYFVQAKGLGCYALSTDADGRIWAERQAANAQAIPFGARTPEDVVELAEFERLAAEDFDPLPDEFAAAPLLPTGFRPGSGEQINTEAGMFALRPTPYRFIECDSGGTVNISYNPSGYSWGTTSLATAVAAAATAWTDVSGSRLRMAVAGTTSECGWRPIGHAFTISTDCGNEVAGNGCYSGVIAIGGARSFTGQNVTVNGTSFRVVDTAHVVVNDGGCDLNQSGVNGVLMHEVGHCLGLDHSAASPCCTDATPTMYGGYFSGMSSLAEDDRAGARFIYPAPPAPPRITAITPTDGERGTTVRLQLSGTDLLNGTTTVAVSGNGISPSPAIQAGSTATALTVTFGIQSTASLASRTVTVTTALGSDSKSFEIVAVRAPTLSGSPGTATGTVRLTWIDNSSAEDGFKVQRFRGSDSTWVTLATLGANVVTYSDTGLTSGRNYKYRVKATRGADSSASNQVTVDAR